MNVLTPSLQTREHAKNFIYPPKPCQVHVIRTRELKNLIVKYLGLLHCAYNITLINRDCAQVSNANSTALYLHPIRLKSFSEVL